MQEKIDFIPFVFYLCPMFFRHILVLFFLVCSCALFAAESEVGQGTSLDSVDHLQISADVSGMDAITEFQRSFPLRFLCNYNFLSLWTSEHREGALISNRPVDVGLGFGYRDLYLDLIYALPFTTANSQSESIAFETGLDFFPGNWWIQGKYRRYSGFSVDVDTNSVFVDFWERDVYLSALWMGTANGRFTPRAAYFLDRKQRYSAGSLIIGGRVQHNRAVDRDSFLVYYQEPRQIFSTWADMGYTYTWVYGNDMFLNLWGIAGVAVSAESESKDFFMLPEVDVKVAYGYIADTWSWNTVMEMEYLPTIFNDHWEQKLVCAYKILIVRRF